MRFDLTSHRAKYLVWLTLIIISIQISLNVIYWKISFYLRPNVPSEFFNFLDLKSFLSREREKIFINTFSFLLFDVVSKFLENAFINKFLHLLERLKVSLSVSIRETWSNLHSRINLESTCYYEAATKLWLRVSASTWAISKCI